MSVVEWRGLRCVSLMLLLLLLLLLIRRHKSREDHQARLFPPSHHEQLLSSISIIIEELHDAFYEIEFSSKGTMFCGDLEAGVAVY